MKGVGWKNFSVEGGFKNILVYEWGSKNIFRDPHPYTKYFSKCRGGSKNIFRDLHPLH